jgi:ElaA protein
MSPYHLSDSLAPPQPTPPMRWRCLPFSALNVSELYAVLQLRSAVFVVEQDCVFPDMDGRDAHCLHLLGQDANGLLLAYARLVPPGLAFAEASVGRVVTAPLARRGAQGRTTGYALGYSLGHALVDRACSELATAWGQQTIRIGAQAHLQDFYGQHGFVAHSAPYLEDGISHVEMLRPAAPWPMAAPPLAQTAG